MYIYRTRDENRSYIIDTDTLTEYVIKTRNPGKTLRSKFGEADFVNSSPDMTAAGMDFEELVPFEEICGYEVFDMRSIMVRGKLIHFLVILDRYFYVIDFQDSRNLEGFKVTCCAVHEDHISLYLTRWKGFGEEIVFDLIGNKTKKPLSEKFYRLKDREEMHRVNKMLLEGSFRGIESLRIG